MLAGQLAERFGGGRVELAAASGLAALEKAIEGALGRGDFRALGDALREIQDGELYRPAHSTFAAYTSQRLGLTGHRVRKSGVELSGWLG